MLEKRDNRVFKTLAKAIVVLFEARVLFLRKAGENISQWKRKEKWFMRNLRIGAMVVLAVLWSGAVWADNRDRDDRHDRDDFAHVPQTGQVRSADANNPPRDDGALQKGVDLPTPRFIDKGDGTIKDKLTGLIW